MSLLKDEKVGPVEYVLGLLLCFSIGVIFAAVLKWSILYLFFEGR